MWFVALIPEILDALAAGGSALLAWLGTSGWWQLPVFISLWRVGGAAADAATQPPPAAGTPESPVQRAIGGAGEAAGGAGAAVGGAASAVGSFGQFVSQNPWLVVGGAVALLVLRR